MISETGLDSLLLPNSSGSLLETNCMYSFFVIGKIRKIISTNRKIYRPEETLAVPTILMDRGIGTFFPQFNLGLKELLVNLPFFQNPQEKLWNRSPEYSQHASHRNSNLAS